MTGALLAKEGYRVTVLEKNRNFGGGIQTFRRRGHFFDPGMHVFGGMQPGGNVRCILDYLCISDKLQVEPYHDTLIYNGHRIVLPFGRDAWIEAIGRGNHREELNTYVDALYRLANSEALFNLRPSTSDFTPLPSDLQHISARQLTKRYISSESLRMRVSYISHLYAGRDDSPALLHALTSVLHIDGIYALVPAAESMAHALADIITGAGGSIHTSAEVTAIEADGNKVTAVRCSTERFHADIYISAIPIGALLCIAPPQAFSSAFRKRIAAARQSYSAFCIYAVTKERSLRQTNASYHILRSDANPWGLADVQQNQWPHNMFLMTRSDRGDSQFADTITIVAPMDYHYVQQWNGSTLGHRPDEYRKWKECMTIQAMQMAQEAIGPIETEYIESASPLTLRDYSGTTNGSCYGLHTSTDNPALTTLSPHTRLTNLLLSGQDVNFHGMAGTTLTAILTAEAIVGQDSIVNKIKDKEKQTI